MRLVISLLFCSWTLAAQQRPAVPLVLPSGLRIAAITKGTLKSRSAKVGDRVKLEVLESVLENGRVSVPKGARLLARVSEVAVASDRDPQSRLSIVIERAEWKGGTAILRGFIAAQGRFRQTVVRKTDSKGSSACDEALLLGGASRRRGRGDGNSPPPQTRGASMGCGADSGSTQSYEERSTTAWSPTLGDAKLKVSGDPRIGSVLVCNECDLAVRKGTLLVIRTVSP